MSRVEAAAGIDRLPWLPDEPAPRPAKRRSFLPILAAASLMVAAVGGVWVGVNSVKQPSVADVKPRPTTTVRLPAPRPVQPQVPIAAQPQVKSVPQAQVRPAPVREVKIYIPVDRPAAHEEATNAPEKKTAEPALKAPETPAPAVTQLVQPLAVPKPWNPRVFTGAAGRVVQIGAFGSVHQSKQGWWYMVRAYPAVAHLPAVVRPSRNSKGRIFYRFQVGTTSQAHSEVICQRMAKIHLSCAVVGLPWKAKVER